MRVVAYIRMSTGKQEASPDRQRQEIARHVAAKGYRLVGEYADLAKSGGRTDRRHQFQRMIADAERREFDRILVYDLSRWGRFDSAEAGRWIMPLRDAGVTLETLDRGIVDWSDTGGRIVNLVEQEGKHAFIVDTSRATLTQLEIKAREGRGFHGAPTSYGYIRQTQLRGRLRCSTLEIDPDRAPVVQRIFAAYTSSSGSLKAVAAMLNENRVPPPRGGRLWRSNAVARILQNQAYAGDAVWGRTNQGQHHERTTDGVRKRSTRRKTPATPIVNRDAVPAIVTRDTFDTAQRLLAQRRTETRSSAATRPLSGLVVCERCGCRLHADGPDWLRCPSSLEYVDRQTRCTASRIPTPALVEAIVAAIQKKLLAPDRLRRLRKAIEAEAARRASGGQSARRTDLEARRRAIAAEIANGIERLTQVPPSLVPDLQASLERKAKERDRLTAEIDAATAGRPDVPKIVARAVAALQELPALIAKADGAAVNQAFRAAGLLVVVSPLNRSRNARTARVRLNLSGGLSPTVRCSGPRAGERRCSPSGSRRSCPP